MTYEKAKDFMEWYEAKRKHGDNKALVLTDDAVDLAIDALEKQILKKPIDCGAERLYFKCPTCNQFLVRYYSDKPHHCECGQAILWE